MEFKVVSVADIKTLRLGRQFSLFNKMLLVLTFSDCSERCDMEHSVLRTAINFNPFHSPSCFGTNICKNICAYTWHVESH